MPSLSNLLQATVPITIVRGNVQVTFQARLEKIQANNTEYVALQKVGLDLATEFAQARRQFEQQGQEIVLSQMAERTEPTPADLFRLRGAMDELLGELGEVFGSAEVPDESDNLIRLDIGRALSAVEDARSEAETFDLATPVRPNRQTRRASKKSAAKTLTGEELTQQYTERIAALNVSNKENLARRILCAVSGWDVTEGESAEPVPLSVELLQTLSIDFLADAVREIEKKVLGYSTIAEVSGT